MFFLPWNPPVKLELCTVVECIENPLTRIAEYLLGSGERPTTRISLDTHARERGGKRWGAISIPAER